MPWTEQMSGRRLALRLIEVAKLLVAVRRLRWLHQNTSPTSASGSPGTPGSAAVEQLHPRPLLGFAASSFPGGVGSVVASPPLPAAPSVIVAEASLLAVPPASSPSVIVAEASSLAVPPASSLVGGAVKSERSTQLAIAWYPRSFGWR